VKSSDVTLTPITTDRFVETMGEDWRIAPIKHLFGQSFRLKKYYQRSPASDHDHCAACWAKFMLAEGCLDRGYAISSAYKRGEDSEWICEQCFSELREAMNWKIGE
jgi:hypothetical protein